jgi:tRNA 2-thiocytidine biosynthesis protein TtcA
VGLEYAFREITIMDSEGAEPGCFWCAWNRRKALFQTAHEMGCNKVAFGHHADDIAQTTLRNLFYQSRLRTMEPKVEFCDGVITLIRPLAYIPEKEIVRFAQAAGLPVQPPTCAHAHTTRRATDVKIGHQAMQTPQRAHLSAKPLPRTRWPGGDVSLHLENTVII